MKRKILSLFLALVLSLSLCPAIAASYEAMEPSEDCVEYIKIHEGFSSEPYSDGTGWYIGYGMACNPGDYPNGMSEEQADLQLRAYLAMYAESVNNFLAKYDAAVTQGQFDALCCMTYNFGPGWLNVSNRLPSYLAKGIDNYSDEEIVNAFAAWCHVGGTVSKGLLNRRIMEAKMFLYEDYSYDTSGWCWLILDAAGGELESDVVCYRAGERYGQLPEPTREGYTFLGWLTQDGELLTEEAEAWDNLSVQALWAAQEEPGEEETEEEELPYSDVKKGKWYYEYVYDLSRRGVINGFTDGTFRPAETVSYGQALKLILLSAGYAEQPAEEGSHWASGYLAYAEKKGFVEEGVILDLDMEISREEIAELAAAALELDTWNTGNTPFADTNSGAVLALYREGIVEGSFENGLRLFKGSDFINRAEMSAIVWRIADYVDRTLILFNGYRIPIDYDLRFNPYDQDSFYTEDGRVYYDDDDYDVRYGIDVSFYQKDIDWEAVANDGIDYVIIRAGYRGCSEGELFTDERFYEYIDGATAAGLDVGLYFFSQALNPEEAVEEAEYLLSLIDGYEISYPIAFDWEPLGYSYSRTKDYDYSVLTDCALAFCETIEEAGYLSMVYLNPSFAYLRYDLSRLQGETIWLANYTERTDYYYDFQMWQYGSSGQVDGIEGRVDMNISFYNFARMER